MQTLIPIEELKTHCYKILDNAMDTDNNLIVTKRGKPIATIIPIKEKLPKKLLFGAMKNIAKINGDILNPIEIEWDAQK
jgi:prevent-host-death family protein